MDQDELASNFSRKMEEDADDDCSDGVESEMSDCASSDDSNGFGEEADADYYGVEEDGRGWARFSVAGQIIC